MRYSKSEGTRKDEAGDSARTRENIRFDYWSLTSEYPGGPHGVTDSKEP